jgi:hypothetical protein
MRPTLDISNLLAKLLVGVSTLVLMLPISLGQDERLALADQFGVAHVLGFVGVKRKTACNFLFGAVRAEACAAV